MLRGGLLGAVARRPLALGALLLAFGVHASQSHPLWALLLLPMLGRNTRALLLFFALGYGLAATRATPVSDVATWSERGEGPVILDGLVIRAPELRPDSEILTLELHEIVPRPPGPPVPVRGRVRVLVPRDRAAGESPTRCALAGDRVRVLAKLSGLGTPLHEAARALHEIQVRRGLSGFARVARPSHCRVLSPTPTLDLALAMERTRSELHLALETVRADQAGAVVRAFATGDRSGIPRELQAAFAASGLSHLLAISGLHLAIVAGLILMGWTSLLRRITWINLGPGVARAASVAVLPMVLTYTFLVGLSASAVRAALMMALVLSASWCRRRTDALTALGFAILLMLIFDPWTLYEVSFQLSVAAVFSLIQLYPRLRSALAPELASRPWWWRAPIDIALVSLAATLGTAPLVGFHFGRVSLVGLFVNVPAAPLASLVLVPLSLVGALGAHWSVAALMPVLDLATFASERLIDLARGAEALPGAALTTPPLSAPVVALLYLGLYALTADRRLLRRLGLVSLIAAVGLTTAPPRLRSTTGTLVLSFLPIGQGDATLIEWPDGQVWLVDVGPPGREGPSAAERVIVPHLRARHISRLDTVVLTHPHADHIGGLEGLLRAVPVSRVLWNGDERESSPALLDVIRRAPSEVVRETPPPWQFGAARLQLFVPRPDTDSPSGVNDRSLVLSIRMGGQHVLITGDAEAQAESKLVEDLGMALRADVLKAGHHGSRTSSTERFLAAVRPRQVVLSLGRDNSFGFPHPEVSKRLENVGAKVWRTDQHGLIRLELDGKDLALEPFVHPLEASPDATSVSP